MAEILAQTALSQDQREMVGIICKSSESLAAIVNDILDLSRTETGTLQLEQDAFDLPNMVLEVEKLLAPFTGRPRR